MVPAVSSTAEASRLEKAFFGKKPLTCRRALAVSNGWGIKRRLGTNEVCEFLHALTSKNLRLFKRFCVCLRWCNRITS